MSDLRQNIKDIDPIEWQEIFAEMGLKPYASKQVYQWIYTKGVGSFSDMTNLSKEAREKLSERFLISKLEVEKVLEDEDGTKKFLFKLKDGEKIESVLIPADDKRVTLCISSQVGCKLGCKFCRTAGIGFKRDLTISEIIDQVLAVSPSSITNLVFMGMGEPLNNYENVKQAIKILTDQDGMSLVKRRVTVSTAGVVPGIKKMSEDNLGVKLAVSLNATTDEVRQKIMPIAKTYSIDELIDACLIYNPPGSRLRTTFEYVLIGGVNDSMDDAKRLVKLMSRLPSKVNLIPFNPYPDSDLKAPKEEVLKEFFNYLYKKHIQVNIRKSRGQNILAACGQLAGE